MSLESLLQSIADAEARGQFSGLIEKHPQFKQYLELGERFAPVATQFGDKFGEALTRLESVDAAHASEDLVRLPEWIDYRNRNWDEKRGMYKQQAAAIDELEQANARIRELEGKEGSEMTLDEIKAALATDPKFSAVDTSKFVSKDELLGSLNMQAQRFEKIYVALTPRISDHEKTFGEAFPMAQVMEAIAKNPALEPNAAYEQVVAPKRSELLLKQHKAEVEQARKDGEAAGRTQAAQEMGGRGVPVSSGAPARGGNWFMQKIFARRAEAQKLAGSGRLGDGTATREGFGKFVEKQMSGGSV